jgi:hypothetical protein
MRIEAPGHDEQPGASRFLSRLLRRKVEESALKLDPRAFRVNAGGRILPAIHIPDPAATSRWCANRTDGEDPSTSLASPTNRATQSSPMTCRRSPTATRRASSAFTTDARPVTASVHETAAQGSQGGAAKGSTKRKTVRVSERIAASPAVAGSGRDGIGSGRPRRLRRVTRRNGRGVLHADEASAGRCEATRRSKFVRQSAK